MDAAHYQDLAGQLYGLLVFALQVDRRAEAAQAGLTTGSGRR